MAASTKIDNQTVSLIAVLAVIAGLAMNYVVIAPRLRLARQDLASKWAVEAGLDTDIAALTRAEGDLRGAGIAMAQRGVSLDAVASVLPADEDVPGLYVQMESLMKEGGIYQPTYQINTPLIDPIHREVKVPVTISATGGYADLKAFLTAMENAKRPLSFTTIGFAPPAVVIRDLPTGALTMTAVGYARAQALSPAYLQR